MLHQFIYYGHRYLSHQFHNLSSQICFFTSILCIIYTYVHLSELIDFFAIFLVFCFIRKVGRGILCSHLISCMVIFLAIGWELGFFVLLFGVACWLEYLHPSCILGEKGPVGRGVGGFSRRVLADKFGIGNLLWKEKCWLSYSLLCLTKIFLKVGFEI